MNPASRSQVRQIITLFGKAGIKDRSKRIQRLSVWTQRIIRSTNDLTVDEANYAIGEIKSLLEGDDGLPVPPTVV